MANHIRKAIIHLQRRMDIFLNEKLVHRCFFFKAMIDFGKLQ